MAALAWSAVTVAPPTSAKTLSTPLSWTPCQPGVGDQIGDHRSGHDQQQAAQHILGKFGAATEQIEHCGENSYVGQKSPNFYCTPDALRLPIACTVSSPRGISGGYRRGKVPEVDEIQECLENADKNLRGALRELRRGKDLPRDQAAQAALFVNGADRAFQAFAAHDDGDRQFARTLRDGDDVDVMPRNCRENPSRQAGSAAHSLAHYRDQSDVGIHLNGLDVAVRQFQRKGFFQVLQRDSSIPLGAPGSRSSGDSWNW